MLNAMKKAACVVCGVVGGISLGKAIRAYGEKRYYEGKLAAGLEMLCDTIDRVKDKKEPECDVDEKSEEA